jgi:hypothetical protein
MWEHGSDRLKFRYRNWDYKIKISERGPRSLALLESDVVFVPKTGGLHMRQDRLVGVGGLGRLALRRCSLWIGVCYGITGSRIG